MKTRNKILLAVGLFMAMFIIAMTVIFCVKGSVPDTLIQMTLGAGGVEAWLLKGITVKKIETGGKAGEREDFHGNDESQHTAGHYRPSDGHDQYHHGGFEEADVG